MVYGPKTGLLALRADCGGGKKTIQERSRLSSVRVIRCDKKCRSNLGLSGRMYARRNHFAAATEISRRGAVVIVQHAAQTFAAPHCSTMTSLAFIRHDQPVAETLVVSLAMVMRYKFVNAFAQRALAEPDHALQAGFLDAASAGTLR
jgi:hypothetical protein